MIELKVVDWDKWQSYRKDRGQPPWIKIHRRLMRNPKWINLSDAERGQLVVIWLLAADHDGVIMASEEMIHKMCFMTSPLNINKFIELGFLTSSGCQSDANMASTCHPSDAPKAETDKIRVEKEQQPNPEPEDDIPIALDPPKPGKKEAASPPASAGFPKTFSGNHFSNHVGGYLDSIVKHADKISTLNGKSPPFNPYKFTQYQIKNKSHPGAIMETLQALVTQWTGIKNVWAYGELVIKTKNGNWHEKEAINDYNEVNQIWDSVLKKNPKLNALILQAMKGL